MNMAFTQTTLMMARATVLTSLLLSMGERVDSVYTVMSRTGLPETHKQEGLVSQWGMNRPMGYEYRPQFVP